ncbi:TPA: hypothetical protein NJ348_004446 [Vibrio parahaemolyticus]|nr:hypothetical protein [Vibrio parahaemolyticus]TBT28603.1 hypothetical protein D5E85_24845 [Vibrio parahaemolyticus]HCG7147251.1 hypothetical protein [Vibrio parahaemolyticus]
MNELESVSVDLKLPYIKGSLKFKPNRNEQNAAWVLFVEYSTRVIGMGFDSSNSSLTSVNNSLRQLCSITRSTLADAGPTIGSSNRSLGAIGIHMVGELTRYLSRWSFHLEEYLKACGNDQAPIMYKEKSWEHYSEAVAELKLLQVHLNMYVNALGKISGSTINLEHNKAFKTDSQRLAL